MRKIKDFIQRQIRKVKGLIERGDNEQAEYLYNVEQIQDIAYNSKLLDVNPFYIRDGKGYRSTIIVYDVPTDVPLGWLTAFTEQENYVTIDIVPLDLAEVKTSIKKAVREMQDRIVNSKDEFEQIGSDEKLTELVTLIKELTGNREKILGFQVKIYVYAHTLVELEQKQADIIRSLSEKEFEGAIYANEQMLEEHNKFYPSDTVKLQGNNKTEITTLTLSAGYPFQYFDLQDQTGIYWGINEIGANMMFDLFTNDGRKRLSYNMAIVGKMNFGKSATLAKMVIQRISSGDRVRISDITGEHVKVTQALGGRVLYVDGIEVAINPHMLKIHERKDVYTENDFKIILNNTIATASNFLRVHNRDLKNEHISLYRQIVYKLYVDKGALTRLLTTQEEIIFSDVLDFCRKAIDVIQHDNTKKVKFKLLQELELTLENLTTGVNASYFNKKSTYNYYEEQLVCFVLRQVTKNKDVLIPQLFLMNQMFWNEMLFYGTDQKRLLEEKKITFEDSKKYLVVSDESHYYLNANEVVILDDIIEYLREARKYLGGYVIASHNIKDYVPQQATKEGVDKLKTMFELMQYKMVMNQDINAREELKEIFGEELKEYHIQHINKLEKGQAILNISGFQTQMLSIHLTQLEKKYLGGGV